MKLSIKYLGITIGCMLIYSTSFSQINILNAKTPDQIGVKTKQQLEADNDKALPYGYVDDRDVLWSVTVWEVIDLNERVNFPLLYPVDTMAISSDRRSLYDVLIKNMKNGKLTDTYVDSYFTEKRSYEDLKGSLSKADTLESGYNKLNSGGQLSAEDIDTRELSSADIVQYRIKGIWYFDIRQGELKYRLLGIAPVAPDVNFIDNKDAGLVELFWVWYPKVRDILHEAKVFNNGNSARSLSFDHLLNARMFNATIYKKANIQGDREVKEYLPDNSLFQLLESDKIKEYIRDREQDMWTN